MTKRAVRPSTPEDADAIVALFRDAGMQPNADQAALHWKYWDERADWPHPRSFVLASGTALLAHGALVPGTLLGPCGAAPAGHVIDWVAQPGEFGAGTAVMKHIAQQVGALIAIGGSDDTLRILPHLGFRPLGVADKYVRPLSPLRLRPGAASPRWKLAPRIGRSLAWQWAAPARPAAGWHTRRLRGDAELATLAPVLPRPAASGGLLGRSVDLFRYTLRCPIVPSSLYAVEEGTRVRGYCLLTSTPGQVRIADCWVDSAHPADWRAMLLCAVDRAREDAEAAELVIWASDPLLRAALPLGGFHRRGSTPIRVRPVAGNPMPEEPLRVQMLDNDAAFFHEGHPEFWA